MVLLCVSGDFDCILLEGLSQILFFCNSLYGLQLFCAIMGFDGTGDEQSIVGEFEFLIHES